jgi:hypothetical protein
VTFEFKAMPDGMFQITSIAPSSSASEPMKGESNAEGTTAMQGKAKQ